MNDGQPQLPVFDTHFHIIDGQFSLVPNRGYIPPSFTVDDYRKVAASINVDGGVVVSGSFQSFDQTYLIDALRRLGPRYVGVTQLPFSVTDNEIMQLERVGVRGVRFNLKRGPAMDVSEMQAMAQRVQELARWHVELYIDGAALEDVATTLTTLPKVCIDHLGLSKSGLQRLLYLVERGVRVKASGFSRVDFSVKDAIQDISAADPNALMFGTDLPGTRAPRPFVREDLTLIVETLGEVLGQKVLFDNAVSFYRPMEVSESIHSFQK